jgi:hypothetical protein
MEFSLLLYKYKKDREAILSFTGKRGSFVVSSNKTKYFELRFVFQHVQRLKQIMVPFRKNRIQIIILGYHKERHPF